MDGRGQTGAFQPGQSAVETKRLAEVTRQVAWRSLILVLGLESLLVLTALFTGTTQPAVSYVIDAAQKIPWAFFLCAALAIGLVSAESNRLVVVLAGLIAAPVASLVAHSLLEGVHALVFAGALPAAPSPYLIALVRGAEYAVLGYLVVWLAAHSWVGPHHHALVGLVTGLIFGSVVLALSPTPLELAPALLLPWIVNEVLFPVGCALILYQIRE